ncbi:MAG: D-aminoacylase [Candidatus Heimdallarchaeota archaeon]|nr:D-aminoacylase [Candidatus Heimdallarchaeota archaeon]
MSYDILIQNGTIVDGTGNLGFKSDIAIKDGKIVQLQYEIKETADVVIDALGLLVSPGFIDMHSHSDVGIPYDNRLQSIVSQGITTSVVGQCGYSLAPVSEKGFETFKRDFDMGAPPGVKPPEITWRSFKEYLEDVERKKISSNIVPLVGFGPIRIAGGPSYENREPTEEELQEMKELTKEAMEAGAFGISTGLIYSPQVYSKTDEVIELVKVVKEYNGLYFSHIRNEGTGLLGAVREFIEIVEKSGVRGGQIAHFKCSGKGNWGKSVESVKLVEEANARGLDITCDQYPYNRSATSMSALLPPWALEGGIDETLKRLSSEEIRAKIKTDMVSESEEYDNLNKEAGSYNVYISDVKVDEWKDVEGKNVGEITEIKGKTDPCDTIFDMLLENEGEVGITIRSMGEEDINRIMKSKYTSIGCDGWGVAPDGIMGYGKPHPRFYGTFPRIIRKYVKEEGLLTLEEAIRKMTSLSAQKLGLFDRGLIREGMWADITIFDYERIYDKATYEEPHQFSEGIEYVLVNGEFVLEKGKLNERLPGKVLRR